ncbi:MAG: MGMT family protein [Clostridia bacterium]|nr:MGMT family protein [Clostridia bacterium]
MVYEKIYETVKRIPKGKVATYGQIAALAGNINWCRTVGNALHKNPNPAEIPCHRVVNANGELAKAFVFGGIDVQKMRLEDEGVKVVDGKVDLSVYRMTKLLGENKREENYEQL